MRHFKSMLESLPFPADDPSRNGFFMHLYIWKCFHIKIKTRSRRYPAETTTIIDDADRLTLFANRIPTLNPFCWAWERKQDTLSTTRKRIKHLYGLKKEPSLGKPLTLGDQFTNAAISPTLRTMSTYAQGRYYLPTPTLGQDMTQGQFLSGV